MVRPDCDVLGDTVLLSVAQYVPGLSAAARSLVVDSDHGLRAHRRGPSPYGWIADHPRYAVTASMVLGQLAAGRTIDDVLADYPYLERDDVLAALKYAAAAVSEREVRVARPA